MSAADAAFDRRLAQLDALAKLPRSAAPAIARAVELVQHETIAAGTDPQGRAWPLTKTGEKPLQHAAAAVTVTPVDGAIVIAVEGHEALHDKGKARGHVRRQIIPSGALPRKMSAAIGDAVDQAFTEITSGGRR